MTRLSPASSRLLKEVGGAGCEMGSTAAAGVSCPGRPVGLQLDGRAPSANRSLADLTDPFLDLLTGWRRVADYLQVSLPTFAQAAAN